MKIVQFLDSFPLRGRRPIMSTSSTGEFGLAEYLTGRQHYSERLRKLSKDELVDMIESFNSDAISLTRDGGSSVVSQHDEL